MSKPEKWKLILHGNEQYPFPLSIVTEDGTHWITRDGTVSSLARARLIVRAVNAFDELVLGAQAARVRLSQHPDRTIVDELVVKQLEKALALAKGEPEPHVSRGRCPNCRQVLDPDDSYCKCDAQAEKAGE